MGSYLFCFILLILYIYLYAYGGGGTCVCHSMKGQRTTCRSLFSLCAMWLLGSNSDQQC